MLNELSSVPGAHWVKEKILKVVLWSPHRCPCVYLCTYTHTHTHHIYPYTLHIHIHIPLKIILINVKTKTGSLYYILSHCISYSFCCDEISSQKQCKGERNYFSSQSRIGSAIDRKWWWQEFKAAGHMTSTVEKQMVDVAAQLAVSFYWFGTPAYWKMLRTSVPRDLRLRCF